MPTSRDCGLSAESEMSAATGLKSWLTTTDHNDRAALLLDRLPFFLIAARSAGDPAQLASPTPCRERRDVQSAVHDARHHDGFLALMPLSAAFFNYIIPCRSARGTWRFRGSMPSVTGCSFSVGCS